MSAKERDKERERERERDKERERDGEGVKKEEKKQQPEREKEREVERYQPRDQSYRLHQKWLSFLRPRVVLGFDKIPHPLLPIMSAKSRGIALCFEKLQGWTVPVHLLQDMDISDYDVTLQLSLSLFHLKSKTFFGSTWMGSTVSLCESGRDVIPDVIDISYSEIIYLISRLADPSCVAVVEVVVSKSDKAKRILMNQFGCGWTMLTLFANQTLQDITSGYSATPLSTSTLYKGSPRDLIPLSQSLASNGTVSEIIANLHELPGCSLQFRIFLSSQLLRAQRLISENELISRFEPVGGLALKAITLPTELRLRQIACIGDREEVTDKRGVVLAPAAPALAKTLQLQVVDWHLMIPGRIEYESRVRIMVTKQMNLLNQAKSKIIKRKLKIGLHNGHTLMTGLSGGEWFEYQLEEDNADLDLLVTSEEFVLIPVNGYPPHEYVALLLLVEYEIGVQVDESTQYDAQSTVKAALKEGDLLISTVSIGAAAFIPYDGSKFELKNIQLTPGETPTEDSLNIELDVKTDDLCRLISPNLIFRDENSSKEGDDTSDLVMGFDLKVFDRKKEFKHGDSYEELEIPDEPEEEKNEKKGENKKSSIRPTSPSRIQKSEDFDPDVGREPSLVGGSSDASSLRLDYNYYGYNEDDRSSIYSREEPYQKPPKRIQMLPPSDPNSLLRRSLQTNLVDPARAKNKLNSPQDDEESFLEIRGFGSRADPRPTITGNNSFNAQIGSSSRELTRAAKSRLSRHGFSDAIGDSLIDGAAISQVRISREEKTPLGVAKLPGAVVKNTPVDIELEANDTLCIHEVSLQFAGYRVGSLLSNPQDDFTGTLKSKPNKHLMNTPRAISCSYQFYTCRPTRTEALKLLPASESSSFSVLVREESSSGRTEAPLLVRHIIDCGNVSAQEGYEFAEYLAFGTLYVDVWDSDSMLHIGVVAIPLRNLMRQGKSTSKLTLECDIVNSDSSVLMDRSGIQAIVVVDGQAPLGIIVGSLSVILSNVGIEGQQIKRNNTSHLVDGLNWRASFGFGNQSGVINRKRPKNSVRAKPLSESAPDLHRALEDYRHSSDSKSGPMKSLSAIRGNESVATLTYDEVITLFKRFKGTVNGTIQYDGQLLKLLNVPSWSVSMRKLIKMFKKSRVRGNTLKSNLLQFADARGLLSIMDLQEFLHDSFEQYGIVYRPEEVAIISSKIAPSGMDVSDQKLGTIRPDDFIKFCTTEADRQDWVLSTRRVKRTIQKALVAGIDVEQLIAEKDIAGDDQISILNLKFVLSALSKFGKINQLDSDIIVRYLVNTQGNNSSSLSAKLVAGFLGIKYTGNIEARLRRCICGGLDSKLIAVDNTFRIPVESIFVLANQETTKNKQITSALRSKCYSRLSFDEFEERLRNLKVFNSVSHEQLQGVFNKAGLSSGRSSVDGLSVVELLKYLKIDFSGLLDNPDQAQVKTLAGITPNDLLKILLERAASDGAAIDSAFRHFDADGNGSITGEELEKGLEDLKIFEAIPNWKSQIPDIMSKFDVSGDGSVSLSEFFKYLGADRYIPNIIQKMTKIFAAANLSLQQIFTEFDNKKLGYIVGQQLQQGLKDIGGFDDVTPSDINAILKIFDHDGDGKITSSEFISFFTDRVTQAKKDRKARSTIRLKRRLQEVINAVVEDGGTLEQIFRHFDQDAGGTITANEFATKLKTMPNFTKLTNSDIQDLVALLDNDGDGTISFEEFKAFVTNSAVPSQTGKIIERLRAILKAAEAKGKSPQDVFAHLDKNGDGHLTLNELQAGLMKIQGFTNLTPADFQELFRTIDSDGSNEVSVQEFIELVVNGGISKPNLVKQEKKDRAESKDSSNDSPPAGSIPLAFARRVLRMCENESGGLVGIIAFLDDDEDGLISLNRLMKFFRREELFDRSLTEDQVDEILSPIVRKDGNIRADHLLKFIENGGSNEEFHDDPIEDYGPYQSDDEDIQEERPNDYEYSLDPEVRAIEKKLRDLGNKLAKKGVDVESFFKNYDPRHSGVLRRTEFLEILSMMGMYILEQGKTLRDGKKSLYDLSDGLNDPDQTRISQQRQISKLRQRDGGYPEVAGKAAQRLIGNNQSDFKDHLESLALIDWYRQGQKRMLLQRVLSHSLASSVHIYPRFGKTLFFEHPLTNPFGHEERFLIEIADSELRIVSSFDEWTHLRNTCRPCVGSIGTEPVEAEMFDIDGVGNIQVSLLAHEALYIPFTFLTFQETFSTETTMKIKQESKNSRGRFRADSKDSPNKSIEGGEDEEIPIRVVDVRVISGTHGHVVMVLRVHIHPRSFIVTRNIVFYEPENTIMKRRIQIKGNTSIAMFPKDRVYASRYIHCVEINSDLEGGKGGQIRVDWGPAESDLSGQGITGAGSLDVIVRYRCLGFPSVGSFYLLLYSDPYQCILHEIWYVTVQTRQRLDLHCSLGSKNSVDLVVRGDKYARRVRAFSGGMYLPNKDNILFQPESYFQLIPGAYNRVLMSFIPRSVGSRRAQINLVDVDTRELVSSWLLLSNVSAPVVVRTYDVDVMVGRPIQKKIVFKNPWDLPRKFYLVSSDDTLMRPRTDDIEVGGNGTAYLKLWFSGVDEERGRNDVYLFLNDDTGHSEECFLFQLRRTERSRL